jgi:mRNA interferase MazF
MQLRFGDVVLIRIDPHQTPGVPGKVRPAIVLLDAADDDFVAAPVTSRQRTSDFDLSIVEWQIAGLNVPSWIRIHKLTVLPKSGLARRLGSLSSSDRGALAALLSRAFTGQ